jgi:pimeloyl-[acyl-carrier protein] methyl ester esterase
VSLHTITLGDGPDVVLLHGWGMHSGVWTDVAKALSDEYRVTLMDLPGHGDSPPGSGGADLPSLCDEVAGNAPPAAIWVGWSLGGLLVQWIAARMPDRVTRLALIASSPRFVRGPDWPCAMEPGVLGAFAESLDRDPDGTLKRFLALQVHGSARAREQLRQLQALVVGRRLPDLAALRDGLALLAGEDLRGMLADIVCPTVLLMGQRDNLVPAHAGRLMRELLPNARLQVFPDAGHAPFLSHPEAFTNRLRELTHE